jgi:hypothetical protein
MREHRMRLKRIKDVHRILREDRRVVDELSNEGCARPMLRHKKEGSSVVIGRDGKIDWAKPEDLGY